ncbi:MAG: hypothetical protein WBM44_02810, partial [Waterburya sp.]
MLQQLNWTNQAIANQTLKSLYQQADLDEQSGIPQLNWTNQAIANQALESVDQQADLDEQSN